MSRHRSTRRTALIVSFALAMGAPLSAFADLITLQIPNIPGDAKFAANNALPPDSIRVLTVGNMVENTTTTAGGGSGAGKPVLSNLSIVKKFGESSAALFLLAVQGKHAPTATIGFYRMKQGVPTRYYTITLSEVFVALQNWAGNSGAVDSADLENLELAYSRIVLLDNETGARACYDLRTLETSC